MFEDVREIRPMGVGEKPKEWEKWAARLKKSNDKLMEPKRGRMREIAEQWKQQFETRKSKPNRYHSGSMMFEVLWRAGAKIKLLESEVHLTGAPSLYGKIVSAYLDHAKRMSGLEEAYTGEFGVKRQKLKYGNGVLEAAVSEEETGWPTRFLASSLMDEYFDPEAVVMHAVGDPRDCRWRAKRYRYEAERFFEEFPDMTGKVEVGILPLAAIGARKDSEKVVELMRCQDKISEEEIWFAGSNAQIITRYEGEGYLHRDLQGRSMLPVFLFGCFPEDEMLFDWGMGELFWDLHEISRDIMNRGTHALYRNLSPIAFVAAKKENGQTLQKKMFDALKVAAGGGEAVVQVDVDGNGNPTIMPLKNLVGAELTSEFERINRELIQKAKRIGIDVDDVAVVTGQTATESQRREQAGNAFTLQMEEGNMPEIRRAYEKLLTDQKQRDEQDDTPIKVDFDLTEQDIKELGYIGGRAAVALRTPTLGGVTAILKKFPAEVIVHGRTGAHADRIAELERAKENIEAIAEMAPGSKAHKQELMRRVRLNGGNYDESDFEVPQAPQPMAA